MEIILSYSPTRLLQRWISMSVLLLLGWLVHRLRHWTRLDIAEAGDTLTVVLALTFLIFTIISVLKGFFWKPPVIITSEGVQDTRLRIGVLGWKQIRRARLFRAYGTTMILMHLVDPNPIVRRLPIFHRLMSKYYKLDDDGDIYIDLTELNCTADVVLRRFTDGIQSAAA